MFWLACAAVLTVIGGSVGIDKLAGQIIIGLGVICLLWALLLFARHRRASDEPQPELPAPAPPARKGIVNKPGALANLHRPKFGPNLGVGVENEGELNEHDGEHE